MLYPTINELTKDEYNRYELALATAKCARMITDEYVRQREAIEKSSADNKEANRSAMNAINKEFREEKAVKLAINRIHGGEYTITRTNDEAELEEEETVQGEAEAEEAVSESEETSEEN